MIPAAQIVAAFQQQFNVKTPTTDLSIHQSLDLLASSSSSQNNDISGITTGTAEQPSPLDGLLQMAELPPATHPTGTRGPIILQLGGRDPQQLALASAIGSFYGYNGINLNCGCPSNAVSGGERSGGAALMREPSVVARCLEQMSHALDQAGPHKMTTTLSVKHRLGVHNAATYNAQDDRARPDGDYHAFQQCRDFVRTISLGGDISKIQVHARLGLLGDFDASNDDDNKVAEDGTNLWVPGTSTATDSTKQKIKVDHKRVQYRAKKQARYATIRNRSVPPLRPKVVDMMAAEFPQLQVITNGGIGSLQDIQSRVPRPGSKIAGAMVGRAAINHPCAFGNVDAALWGHDDESSRTITRESVLLDYIQYCQKEEAAFFAMDKGNRSLASVEGSLVALRRRLVAVPFHLFAGEVGNEEYQRRIRKLVARAQRHSSGGILTAALSVVPTETALKSVTEYATQPKDIPTFQASRQRSGPLQRTIF
ncbi:dihydrouridine(20/20a) synthase [Seminavis robusta]|uniref:Dihydrouridine(20/20a) synthase n=1 Tax=Seminavis robusta TaxID=568900 RepID=A0A9N8EM53_9STRA|nr:dihydrouridine(20/20a) synthase [Seminavis robusta]|eukprot:Sro1238_g255210.1 dihydrouridine(20/20a) synthase (481) ;mRNA; r:8496-9938